MPRALTLEEKKAAALAKQEAKVVRSTSDRPSRKNRENFGGTTMKLGVRHQIEGYHLHIFNDEPGRIDWALANDYEFVTPEEVGGTSSTVVSRNTDVGDKVRFLVGTSGSEPQYGYLMKVKQEWFDEDQEAIQDRVDRTDQAIRRGKFAGEGQSSDGFYDAGIKIT
jgi:hypothetical protein